MEITEAHKKCYFSKAEKEEVVDYILSKFNKAQIWLFCGKYKLEETKAPEGYLTAGTKPIEFSITENGKIVVLTDESHSIYNQIKRGNLEGVKIGAGTHKRLANVPFKITSKTTGESHIIVKDKNGQFSTASDWASHKKNTNVGKTLLFMHCLILHLKICLLLEVLILV